MEIKKALHDSIIVPTLMYQVRHGLKVEMSYLRDACGLNRMDSESSESEYGKFGVFVKSEGMNCGVVEVVKHSTLRWLGHLSHSSLKIDESL